MSAPSDQRVMALLQIAVSDGDLPAHDAVLDLVMAAASLMVAVVTASPSAPTCPPIAGNPKIEAALQAVSELADSMLKRDVGEPS